MYLITLWFGMITIYLIIKMFQERRYSAINVQRMFRDEVREKKRTASGVHSKTGKRGYVGKMLFPTDIMSRKDKYNYRKAGKVVSYKMSDRIMPYDEFQKLPIEEQRVVMIDYRIRHTNEKIRKEWGLNTYQYFTKLLKKDLQIEVNSRRSKIKEPESKPSEIVETPVKAVLIESNTPQVPQTPALPAIEQVSESAEEGFTFRLSGTYTAEALVKKLRKLGILLEGEEPEFHINLFIKENLKTS